MNRYAKRLASAVKLPHPCRCVKSNPNASNPLAIFAAYFLGVIVLACLLAPPLYWVGNALAEIGVLPFLRGFPFHRYFSRCLQISALALLFPAFRAAGIRQLAALGIDHNPGWKRDLAAGFVIAFVPVVLLAAAYIGFDVYRLNNKTAIAGVLRVVGTAAAVPILEEFLFRGVLLGLCLRIVGPIRAAAISSLVFGIAHFLRVAKPAVAAPVGWLSGFAQLPLAFSSAPPWPLLGWGFLSLVVAGLILAFATLSTRSLFLAIGLHAGWILGQQGLQLIAKYHIKPPDALLPWVGQNVVSGAVPTGIVPTAVLLATAGVVALYFKHAKRRSS